MRYLYFLLLVCLICTLPVSANQVRIEVSVTDLPPGKIHLSLIKGDEFRNIDSVFVSGEIFRFNLYDPDPGVYRVTLGKTPRAKFFDEDPQFFDFIIHEETEINLRTNFFHPGDSMLVINSLENRLYYEYLSLTRKYKRKGGALLPLYGLYDGTEDFFPHFHEEFIKVQKEYNESLLSIASKKPESFASSYIKMHLVPGVDPSGGMRAMNEFLRNHFFDLVIFNDERLINSQVYTRKIMEYFNFYGDPSLTQSEQEEKYIDAVDFIMERASYNEKVFGFILDYLIDVFDHSKMELVVVHLLVEYVEKGCETDNHKIMDQRLEAYKRMAIGKQVNDIVLLDINGLTRRLYELDNEYVLVLFWSSWCPYCERLLPELKQWYLEDRETDLEIFAVSIDTSRVDWEANVLQNNYPWINVCTLQGWEGKAAADYNIYASPTMFIIDRQRQILAKPTTLREFMREIRRL